MVFLLDNNITTGIKDSKLKRVSEPILPQHSDNKLKTFEEVMEYLKNNNTGTDEVVGVIQRFLHDHCNKEDDTFDFYVGMVTKNLKIGCDKKTVNKAIPGLIPTFNVMLGTPIDKCKLADGEWISLSRKLNGTRCAFVGNKCMTRQGKEYIGVNHIINDLKHLGYENYFVDGELLYKNAEGLSDSEAFQKGTGIAMSKDSDKSQLKLVAFDIFPLHEFWSGKSIETYKQRKTHLLSLDKLIREMCLENIEVVPMLYEGTNHSEIWKWLEYAEKNDWEGIMINLDTIYECKRTKNLIKVKKFFSCDIQCIGIEEGAGRNKGTLGALVCNYKGNEVRVGSGFSDEDRRGFWSHPEKVVGHIISVKYKEETKNKSGGISIQFPVFEAVRFDKTVSSYN